MLTFVIAQEYLRRLDVNARANKGHTLLSIVCTPDSERTRCTSAEFSCIAKMGQLSNSG